MSEGGVDITHQHSTHNQHIAHISRTVLSTSVVVSVLIVSQRSCSSSGRTVLHGLHAYLWLKEKNRYLQTHPLSVVRILSGRLLCLHLQTHMHFGSSLSLSCHLHGHPCVCGLSTLILPFYFLIYLPPLFLFLNDMKSVVHLHNSCNESVDASDELARRVVRRFAGEDTASEHDGSRTQSAHHGVCGYTIPNL